MKPLGTSLTVSRRASRGCQTSMSVASSFSSLPLPLFKAASICASEDWRVGSLPLTFCRARGDDGAEIFLPRSTSGEEGGRCASSPGKAIAVSSDGLLIPPPPVCLKLVGRPMSDLSMPPLRAPASCADPCDEPKRSLMGLEGRLSGEGPPLMPADESEAVESLRLRVEGNRARDRLVGLPGGAVMPVAEEVEVAAPLRGENILVGEGERAPAVAPETDVRVSSRSELAGGKSLLLMPLVDLFRKRPLDAVL